jgi:hypothetical protein
MPPGVAGCRTPVAVDRIASHGRRGPLLHHRVEWQQWSPIDLDLQVNITLVFVFEELHEPPPP